MDGVFGNQLRKYVTKVNEEEVNFLPTSPTLSFYGRMCSILKVSISYWRQCLHPVTGHHRDQQNLKLNLIHYTWRSPRTAGL